MTETTEPRAAVPRRLWEQVRADPVRAPEYIALAASEKHGPAAEAWAAKALAPLLDLQMAKRTVININFPAVPADAVRGIRVVRQGFHDYARGSLLEGTDPRGRPYYWFGLQDVEHTLDHGTDLEAVNEGYIAVTPLQLDLTHHASIGNLGARPSARSRAARMNAANSGCGRSGRLLNSGCACVPT